LNRMNNYYQAPRRRPMRPSDAGCSDETPGLLATLPVAMAYVPMQVWQTVYDGETGLARGTIFPCLDLPFLAYRGASL